MTAELLNVLSVVAWATRLSLALYDLCPTVPTASHDIIALAREVTLIAKILRQVGDTLKQNYTIPSEEGAATLQHILSLCQRNFREIEKLVPVRGRRPSNETLNALRITDASTLPWDQNASNGSTYIRLYLKSIRMTTAVLVQTVCVAKATAYSNHVRRPYAYDEVVTERCHLESLIVEQQLAILRVRRCHTEIRSGSGTLPSSTLALLISGDSQELGPQDLLRYHEASLSRARPGASDVDDILMVRHAASPYIDVLLARWTNPYEVQQSMSRQQSEGGPVLRLPAAMDDRRRAQQPSVESDTESEYHRHTPSSQKTRRGLGFSGPVLLHVDDRDDVAVASPPSTPLGTSPMTADLRSPNALLTRSLSANAASLPQPKSILKTSPTSINTRNVGGNDSLPSSYNSRGHLSAGPNMPTSPAFPPTFPPPPTVHAEDFATFPSPIPWRLSFREHWWDHHGANVVKSNTNSLPHASTVNDRATATIISSEHVSRRVIDEANYECTTTQQPSTDDRARRPRHEIWHRIHRGLTFPQVQDLVRRSAQLRRPETEPRLQRSQTSTGATMSSLDRSRTIPMPTIGPQLVPGGHASQQARRSRAGSNASHATSASYASHRSMNRSPPSSLSGDSDDEKVRREQKRDRRAKRDGRDRDRDRDRNSRGKSRLSSTGKALLGAGGLWALLEGLPDALHVL